MRFGPPRDCFVPDSKVETCSRYRRPGERPQVGGKLREGWLARDGIRGMCRRPCLSAVVGTLYSPAGICVVGVLPGVDPPTRPCRKPSGVFLVELTVFTEKGQQKH